MKNNRYPLPLSQRAPGHFSRHWPRIPAVTGFLCGVIWVGLLAAATTAQDEVGARRHYTLFNGTRVFFSLDTDAPGSTAQLATRIQVVDLNAINRVLVDQKSGLFFGYRIQIEPMATTRQYRVRLQPLSPEQVEKLAPPRSAEPDTATLPGPEKSFAASQSGRPPAAPPATLLPVTRFPAPQTIEDGDTIAVEVLANPTTGARLTDRITITSRDAPLNFLRETMKTRDFSLDDIELKISNYRLLVNRQMVTPDKPQAGCAGPLVWFYLPGQGRFVFSIRPREGYDFQKIGTVQDNTISFFLNGLTYEWQSESPILGTSGKWNLWVLHDPHFLPETNEAAPVQSALDPVRRSCCLIGSTTTPEALFRPALSTPKQTRLLSTHRVEPNVLAPDLYADELQIKHVLVDFPGASSPESKWEVSWQVWFVPEAEEKRVLEEISTSQASGGRGFSWDPRPENFAAKIALAHGTFTLTSLQQLKDRINISAAFPFKSKIPSQLQTKFATLMISYVVRIQDGRLQRTIARSSVWLTKPFDDDPNNPLRAIQRSMLHSNWYVTAEGELYHSQLPRKTNSLNWIEE